MELKDIKLRKGMTKEEVNKLTKDYILLEDEVYIGNHHKHNWRCLCGNAVTREWNSIRLKHQIKCNICRYKEKEQRYKEKVEEDSEYEYIRAYFKGDILPNGKLTKIPYIQVKHKYCNNIYEVSYGDFKRGHKCGKCCRTYENSFAYHIEVELGEPLEKYWDFEKNTVNPYHVYKSSGFNKVWIKCQEKDYHESYKIQCSNFYNGSRCSYCHSSKIHLLDSFGYNHPEKLKFIHPDNKLDLFKIGCRSNKKIKIICNECNNVWMATVGTISKGHWCPKCASSKGEKRVSEWLDKNNVEYKSQKEYHDLIGLGGGRLSYDFYLPEYNLLIEYQGEFHDGTANQQTENEYMRQQEHDRRKRKYAKEHNIDLLEIWYYDFDNIEEILGSIF